MQDADTDAQRRWTFVARLGLPLIAADACEPVFTWNCSSRLYWPLLQLFDGVISVSSVFAEPIRRTTDEADEDPGQPYDESPWTEGNIRSLSRAFLGCAAGKLPADVLSRKFDDHTSLQRQ